MYTKINFGQTLVLMLLYIV